MRVPGAALRNTDQRTHKQMAVGQTATDSLGEYCGCVMDRNQRRVSRVRARRCKTRAALSRRTGRYVYTSLSMSGGQENSARKAATPSALSAPPADRMEGGRETGGREQAGLLGRRERARRPRTVAALPRCARARLARHDRSFDAALGRHWPVVLTRRSLRWSLRSLVSSLVAAAYLSTT